MAASKHNGRKGPSPKPLAHPELIVRDLDDESVVYDFVHHRAHCLNEMARATLRCCDGRTDVPGIARRLTNELHTDVSEPVVWMALEQLSQNKLLVAPIAPPVDLRRRRAMSKMALTAGLSIALPAVWSLVAPTKAYAASIRCVPQSICMGVSATTCCGTSGMAAMSCSGANLCTGSGATCVGNTCS